MLKVFNRYHYKDKLVFFYDVRGSVGEVQSQLLDARDLLFLTVEDFENTINQAEKTAVILGGLIRSTSKRSSST